MWNSGLHQWVTSECKHFKEIKLFSKKVDNKEYYALNHINK